MNARQMDEFLFYQDMRQVKATAEQQIREATRLKTEAARLGYFAAAQIPAPRDWTAEKAARDYERESMASWQAQMDRANEIKKPAPKRAATVFPTPQLNRLLLLCTGN